MKKKGKKQLEAEALATAEQAVRSFVPSKPLTDIGGWDDADLVKEGFRTVMQMARFGAKLKQIEAELRARALKASAAGEVKPLEDAELEGTQWIADGDVVTLPVVITSDELIGSFADESPNHKVLEAIAGEKLGEFFSLKKTWENAVKTGKQFRARAAEILGAEKGAELVAASRKLDKNDLPKFAVRVDWNRVKVKPEGEEVAK